SSSKKTYLIAKTKHKVGLLSSLDIVDNKIDLLEATQSKAEIQKQYIANLISLYKVMGGGSDINDSPDNNSK
ncbi:MAG: outer membrane protein TolC, partial [Rickettsiales bacterium]